MAKGLANSVWNHSLAKRKKFSANWQKLQARIQRLHRKIANVRNDFLHKTTTVISKNHAVVVIEDLKVRNMSRSASGTLDAPRRRVRAKADHNAALNILAAGHAVSACGAGKAQAPALKQEPPYGADHESRHR